jgi:predicted RNase H-like HicB family nuclease
MKMKIARSTKTVPVIIELDEDGFYIAECPLFTGCYSQGKTIDEALQSIQEVIDLVLKEPENRKRLKAHRALDTGLHQVAIRA